MLEKKTVLKSDTSDSEQLYFEKCSKYNTNHADFSGENILVAIFWLLTHLKVLRVNPEEVKTWTAFYCEIGFHKLMANLSLILFLYIFISVVSCEETFESRINKKWTLNYSEP